MSAPTQISIIYLVYSNANPTVVTTATQVVSIPSAMQSLDSTTQGSTQTGFGALELLLSGVTKRGGVQWTDTAGTAHFMPLSNIVSITCP